MKLDELSKLVAETLPTEIATPTNGTKSFLLVFDVSLGKLKKVELVDFLQFCTTL
jgi:hypothetical protein